MMLYSIKDNKAGVLVEGQKLLILEAAKKLIPELQNVPVSVSALVAADADYMSIIGDFIKSPKFDTALKKTLARTSACIHKKL